MTAYVHSGEVGTPKQVEKYSFLDAMAERLPKLAAAQSARRRRRRPQRRPPHPRHQELEGQREARRLPAGGARLLRPLRRRRGRRRLQRRRRLGWVDVGRRFGGRGRRARTPGGRGAARRSTTTPAGGSTTSSRPRPSPRASSATRSTGRRPTTSDGPTTRPSSSTTHLTRSQLDRNRTAPMTQAPPLLGHAALRRLPARRQLHRRAAAVEGAADHPRRHLLRRRPARDHRAAGPGEAARGDPPHRGPVHRRGHRPGAVDPVRAVARARARRARLGAEHDHRLRRGRAA